ncbi:MAG: hypothetical protein IPM16_10615 [Chloroflexi bacterium]|nr:hypothetical protein [Chloroflexota bacterium]
MNRSTRRRLVSLGVALLLAWVGAYAPAAPAQDSAEAVPARVRTVGVIAGPELNSASPDDTDENGLSRLAETIRELGGSVTVIPANREIPADVELVLLIRPQRALSVAQTAHLWDFLQRGGHLLLALDPIGHNGGSPESAASSGLIRLLQAEYGMGIVDNLLVESWFGIESLGDVETSWSDIQTEDLFPHAITAPLIQFDLPLRYWGARSMLVDALTGTAATEPLIIAERPYGETARINFGSGDAAQLTRNIGPDTQGRLLFSGIATHFATGSRVALVGDGEIFLNVFGQRARASQDGRPLYMGDDLFAQRLLAWLMAVPEAEYPALPDGYTWIALDGDSADWPADLPAQGGPPPADSAYALQQIRAFQNDQFVYVLLETGQPVPRGTLVYLFVDDADGNRQFFSADPGGVVQSGDATIADADAKAGAGVEIRLPRRIFATTDSVIARVCVGDLSGSAVECFEEPVRPVNTNALDPVPVRFGAGPQAITQVQDTNLRAQPTTRSTSFTRLPTRTLFAAVGRNTAGDWVYVQNGRYAGWINRPLLAINADVSRLPDLEAAP